MQQQQQRLEVEKLLKVKREMNAHRTRAAVQAAVMKKKIEELLQSRKKLKEKEKS